MTLTPFARAYALWLTGCAALITVTQVTPANDLELGALSLTALVGAAAVTVAIHDHMLSTRRADAADALAEALEDERNAEISASLRWHARRDHAEQTCRIATYRTPQMLASLEELQHAQDVRYSITQRGANTRENMGDV